MSELCGELIAPRGCLSELAGESALVLLVLAHLSAPVLLAFCLGFARIGLKLFLHLLLALLRPVHLHCLLSFCALYVPLALCMPLVGLLRLLGELALQVLELIQGRDLISVWSSCPRMSSAPSRLRRRTSRGSSRRDRLCWAVAR